METGSVLAGINHLEDATRLAPDSPGAWVALGDAWLVWGDTPQAAESYHTALELDPDFAEAGERIRQLGAH